METAASGWVAWVVMLGASTALMALWGLSLLYAVRRVNAAVERRRRERDPSVLLLRRVLARRLARGQIDEEDYERLRHRLG